MAVSSTRYWARKGGTMGESRGVSGLSTHGQGHFAYYDAGEIYDFYSKAYSMVTLAVGSTRISRLENKNTSHVIDFS